MAGNCAYFSLRKLHRSHLCKGSNMTLYKMFIRHDTVQNVHKTCGNIRSWNLDPGNCRWTNLESLWEKYGQKNQWTCLTEWRMRLRSCHKIESILGYVDIVGFVKSRRISWLGHVHYVDDQCMPKKILNEEIYSRKKQKQSRKHWVIWRRTSGEWASGIGDWRPKINRFRGE